MGKRDKEIPYEVVIQERKRVDLYGNVVYYIYWFDKYGYNITNEWKFWSKGPKKKYDRVNRYLSPIRKCPSEVYYGLQEHLVKILRFPGMVYVVFV